MLGVLAWFLVATSAIVAPFKYPELHVLQVPVILLTLVGLVVLIASFKGSRAGGS